MILNDELRHKKRGTVSEK